MDNLVSMAKMNKLFMGGLELEEMLYFIKEEEERKKLKSNVVHFLIDFSNF